MDKLLIQKDDLEETFHYIALSAWAFWPGTPDIHDSLRGRLRNVIGKAERRGYHSRDAEVKALRDRMKALTEALEWYAKEEHHKKDKHGFCAIKEDKGGYAQAVIMEGD